MPTLATDAALTPQEPDEAARLAALHRYGILDTPAEAGFDDIVLLASQICQTPVALVSLVEADRQWFKARIGFDACETPLAQSVCAHALHRPGLLVIPDLTQDPRTRHNTLVTGAPHLRFYAGARLETPDGHALGTLCVIDAEPRPAGLTPIQASGLEALARQVMAQMELRQALAARQAALKDVREGDARHRQILDSAIDYAIITIDLDGLVTSWNAGAEHVLGWTEAEMCGRPARVFFTPEDDRAGIPEREMRAAREHGRGNDERWHCRKDGTRFYALGEMMPLKSEDGRHVGYLKILRDRTAQRQAEETQRADAQFMRGVLAASADCIKVLDLDGRLTFMSAGGQQVMEVSDFRAIEGRYWPDFWQDQSREDALAAIAAAKAGGTGQFQGPADTVAGTPRWWDVQVTPILDAAGRPVRLLAVSRNITERKSAEQQIAASEERWRGLFEGMQEGFCSGEILRGPDGQPADFRFLEVNPAFADQTGLPGDIVGRSMRELVPEIPQALIETYARVVETGAPETFEIEIPALRRVFEVRARRAQGQSFAAMFLDISGRKQADRRRTAMAELSDRLRDVTDKAEISGVATEIMGRALGLSRAGYGTVDPERETVAIVSDWTAPGLAGLAPAHHFRDYGSYIADLKVGRILVVDDVAADPRTAADTAAWAGIGVRAVANLPVTEHGRFVALFYLAKPEPHAWTAEEIGFLRSVADRTRAAIARVESEERQQLLNHELSHRMKNLLAMVQSIATQTMRSATDVDSAKEILAARLIALGRAHDLLMGGALGSTKVLAIVRAALEIHTDRPSRFRLVGPDLEIGAKPALSLALMLHELATNAAKYGALSVETGHVAVNWEVVPGAGEPLLRVSWAELDGPPVTPPSRKGFGTRFIERGLAGQVSGTVALTYEPGGVTCTVTGALAAFQSNL
ncbi:PAS domain-containing protein [Methylobacterium soli]|uniref:Blue-light-activated histidine kinase n=2 Tax=Methylobacterium soli TaxID=553447 RepID=A0A6L3T3N4_9HYPH|nr:PAS domain-containing protein [Methylobacterium soli]